MILAECRPPTIKEFEKFQILVNNITGIYLPPNKINLLYTRLGKRLVARQCKTFNEYFDLITDSSESEELRISIEKITTNETYFFREEKHFSHLNESILPQSEKQKVFRVWSAACSTGQEPYSLAMVLQNRARASWQIFASDLNTEVLNVARQGIYSEAEIAKIPEDFVLKYCRKGVDHYQGSFRIAPEIRSNIQFSNINLMNPFDELGKFDLIVLRNVMIYFAKETQQELVSRIAKALKPGGYFYIGHSESLHGISDEFRMLKPAIYQIRN